jgi:hypothetical protein
MEIKAVFSNNLSKPINTKCRIMTAKGDRKHNYRSPKKGGQSPALAVRLQMMMTMMMTTTTIAIFKCTTITSP